MLGHSYLLLAPCYFLLAIAVPDYLLTCFLNVQNFFVGTTCSWL